jgi:hypothetical protein
MFLEELRLGWGDPQAIRNDAQRQRAYCVLLQDFPRILVFSGRRVVWVPSPPDLDPRKALCAAGGAPWRSGKV